MRLILLLSTFIATIFGQQPVIVRVYYDPICTDSRDFINKQFTPTYAILSPIINLRLVPFGNANWTLVNQTADQYDVSFSCLHGPEECVAMQIHCCAIETLSAAQSLALVDCMLESTNRRTPLVSGEECATTLGLNWNSLHDCSSSPLGRGLALRNGEATKSLNPAHTWMPWVTVNDAHTNEIQTLAETNLPKLICDSYTGTKQSECSQ